MTGDKPYIFIVSSTKVLVQDTTNGNAGSDVKWDSVNQWLKVHNGIYAIQFTADGTTLKTVTSVAVISHAEKNLTTDPSNSKQLNTSFVWTWNFTISAEDMNSNTWSWDPKIYNDGSVGDPQIVA